MMKYESQQTVGTCRDLLCDMLEKNGEPKKIKTDETASNEYEVTELTENTVTPRKIVLFEKQTNAELFKKIISFYAAPIFTSYCKTAHLLSVSKQWQSQFFPFHPVTFKVF